MPALFFKCRVESSTAGREIDLPAELSGFCGAEFAIHARVLPLDGQRTFVTNIVKGSNDLLEIHGTTPRTPEIPTTPCIAKIEVARQDPRLAIECRDRVLDMDMIDPIREGADEFDGINTLPVKMTGIKVESELLTTIKIGRASCRERV